MPRRPPPTALRLISGPTPARSAPKHVLPSVPQPIFHPISEPSIIPLHGPPKQAVGHHEGISQPQLPQLDIPLVMSGYESGNSSPDSAVSSKAKMVQGPWDHSGIITLDFDVTRVLTPLKSVAIGNSPGLGTW